MQLNSVAPRKEKLLSAAIGVPAYSTVAGNPIQLDLQYLIGMQTLGYDVLKYLKLSENNAHKASMSTKD